MTSLHQQIYQGDVHKRESAVERLQSSRWTSSSRIIVDKPPSSPRRMSSIPNSSPVEENQHKDLGTGYSQPGSPNGRLQCGNAKWTSGSAVITDSPPSQPPSHRAGAFGSLELFGSRWNSGSQGNFGTASSQTLGCHRTIAQPSSISALEHSAAIKKHHSFETAFCFLNLPRTQTSSGTGSGLRCTTSRSA
jgi:hypothetical protein